MSYKVIRSHEICAGHRVVGHESRCRMLHGHNYKFHFKVAPKPEREAVHVDGGVYVAGEIISEGSLDAVGRVIDFSVVKSTLCEWLEDNWDHKFLHWEKDDLIKGVQLAANNHPLCDEDHTSFFNSMVSLPFNPTAENLAAHMVNVIGPELLDPYGVELVQCVIEETSKCHVEYTK